MSANKSFSTETSERYSRALFEVAKESGDLEKVETDIKGFKSLLENSPELKNFFVNPTHLKYFLKFSFKITDTVTTNKLTTV